MMAAYQSVSEFYFSSDNLFKIHLTFKDEQHETYVYKYNGISVAPLMRVPYRKIKCIRCKKTLGPHSYYSKSKGGLEGPFPLLWSNKESICKCCILSRKAQLYKRKRRHHKDLANRRTRLNTIDIEAFELVVRPCRLKREKREIIYEELIDLLL